MYDMLCMYNKIADKGDKNTQQQSYEYYYAIH